MIEVFDNFLPKRLFTDLQEYYLGPYCEWNYQDNITLNYNMRDHNDRSDLGGFGFNIGLFDSHSLQHNPSYVGVLSRSILYSAQNKVEELCQGSFRLVRARADMSVYNPNKHMHAIHTDLEYFGEPIKNVTCIFYMNDSDGCTTIFDRDATTLLREIEPVGNRLLLFDGTLPHSGHSPSEYKNRVLLNINFMEENDFEEFKQRIS